jgi:4-hydroxythreonine-4-phosphate dehydrogenase
MNPPVTAISSIDDMDFSAGLPNLLDVPAVDPGDVPLGKMSVAAGGAVLEWFGRALDLARDGKVDGICFMPFNKEAMHRAGLDAEDELQWAKKRLAVQGRASEFNVIDGMWNARVTSHVPLRAVADLLTVELIVEAITLANRTLEEAGFDKPRIAVAGINPHAGDGGQIGREEIDVIAPAVERARELGIRADGPFPSDTLYIRVRDKQYDCALSMYHDQGQIAIKLLGFHMGVSVLGGLPFPVATPAHGTAFDIAGHNTARLEPSRRAYLMVCDMAENRRKNPGSEFRS